ncbi:MAG: Co2+/Mg2+ efflux protein ApaG [Fimbriimonadaceae bacterium]|nr:Co2+/Mg2+ efflux protein ApaG [Alphaproteobacteria bacterium]
MYRAITNSIRVTVKPHYMPERSEPDRPVFFWAYEIEIFNGGETTVQLISRRWVIVDALGQEEIVEGLGVVGEQPLLGTGESFDYTSGVPLTTPTGIMSGSYLMVGRDGSQFEVEVPAFSLDSPHLKPVLN